MKEMVARLREKNPELPIYSVYDPAFQKYGRVLSFDASKIEDVARNIAMPEKGVKYSPFIPELENKDWFSTVQNELCGQESCQIGLCWGYNKHLNCLEYHRSSEHNVSVTDIVLLLASEQDLEGFDLPDGKIAGFYVPKDTVIEIYATTLHFTPCQISDTGFKCIVILPRGVNEQLQGSRPLLDDGRLLTAKGKWLIAHRDVAGKRGAYPGISGINYEIAY